LVALTLDGSAAGARERGRMKVDARAIEDDTKTFNRGLVITISAGAS
jgi:hypothetical protein